MSVATKNPFALLDGQYLTHRSRSPRADCLLVSFLASPYCPCSTTASRPSHTLTAHTRLQTTPRRVPLPLLPQRTPLLPLLPSLPSLPPLPTLLLLLRHPEQLAAVRGDATLLEAAGEEACRLIPPVAFVERWTREPLAVGGVTIPAD